MTENRELADHHGGGHGDAHRVGKLSLGAARELDLGGPLLTTIGVTGSINFVPGGLAEAYGGGTPLAGMAFVRVELK
jgi:hypothetical protein